MKSSSKTVTSLFLNPTSHRKQNGRKRCMAGGSRRSYGCDNRGSRPEGVPSLGPSLRGSSSPIAPHQFGDPRGLEYASPRSKLGHPRFEIQNGRSVHGIQSLNVQGATFEPQDPADRCSNLIGSVFTTLCKDSNLRPIEVVTRMACRPLDFIM